MICRELDIDVGRIDGLFGTQTKSAFEAFNRKKHGLTEDAWRDEIEAIPQPGPAAQQRKSAALTTWPRQSDVPSIFGPPCKPPLKRLSLPFKMKIAWDLNKEITGFMIHEKVHDSAARVLDKIHAPLR